MSGFSAGSLPGNNDRRSKMCDCQRGIILQVGVHVAVARTDIPLPEYEIAAGKRMC